ncbi:UDP-N-acetylglucosamine 2-epimerase [Dyadobacter sediminis]|uniref:UDP-N-acetylglucosamine 2-epimerase (Hydrolyzing) n=1 Tax=Dyadobacter sediminis TaxID=1493691 RepID=A0A5R9K795_9BACT|nr:UDP-N-acetylglucosamine 2-epimerase [Dyadobacter sediminis]TLU89738.1 UDP-N-acetylglucosamine 2-epimerase (hydrolyzing) [Dyadobacter sediminis]GGC13151.1 UDP-N-acetyl glucosamine 2-epimerase [Dyadobacter sediminis]
MIRKICIVITARASYCRIKAALNEIRKHPALELQLVVAASALLEKYGCILDSLEKDGFCITAKIFNMLDADNNTAAAKTTGLGTIELASLFENIKPDVVISIGDRFETLSTAIAASCMNITLVHVQGGEVTGNIDQKVRHAVTELADVHFVATAKAQNRLVQIGKNPEYVFNTGCPSIDLALQAKNITQYCESETCENKKPDAGEKYLVVMQHSVTTELQYTRKQIRETLNAVKILNIPTYWFYPNADPGSPEITKGIREFEEKCHDHLIRFVKNFEPLQFLQLIRNSSCLIGNSSTGIREASYLGIPVVNIGTRQAGRERGSNVTDTDYDCEKIVQSVNNQLLHRRYSSETIYGNGHAGKKIAELLATIPLIADRKTDY